MITEMISLTVIERFLKETKDRQNESCGSRSDQYYDDAFAVAVELKRIYTENKSITEYEGQSQEIA